MLCMALILPLPGTLDHTRSRRNSPALEPSASARSAADETLRTSDADIDPIMNLPRRSTTANPLTPRLCITAKHPATEKSDDTAATANVPRVNPSDSIVAVLGKLPSAWVAHHQVEDVELRHDADPTRSHVGKARVVVVQFVCRCGAVRAGGFRFGEDGDAMRRFKISDAFLGFVIEASADEIE